MADLKADVKKNGKSLTELHQDLLHLTEGNEEMVKQFEKFLAQQGIDSAHDTEGKPRGGRSAKSWLQALAQVLGKVADQKAAELQQAADAIGGGGNDPSKMIQFQVLSQEFSLMMQTFTGAVKALAEGITAPAQASTR
jgi:thymidine phosphorylase